MDLKKKERVKGFACAFMAGLLWGATSPIAQFLFENKGIVSSWLVPYRLMTAGILLLGYAVIKKMNITEMWKDKQDAVRMAAFAILGMMGMQYSFFSAVQEMNAGTATIFQYLNPAMLIIYFAIVYRVKPKKKEIIAVFCSLAGIFLVATHGNIRALTISPLGIVLGLILAVTTCCYGVIPMPLLKKFQAEAVCAWAMILGGIVLAFVTRPWRYKVEIDKAVIIAFFAIVIMGTILPFCFYLASLKSIGSVYAGLLSSVEPVAATILAAVFLGTSFQSIDIVGFALVLSTMFILNIGSMKV
jgi:drug/metabolite transporter (DMT)-like permease